MRSMEGFEVIRFCFKLRTELVLMTCVIVQHEGYLLVDCRESRWERKALLVEMVERKGQRSGWRYFSSSIWRGR